MNRNTFFCVLATSIGLGVFLLLFSPARGDNSPIVISEIAAYGSTGHEWIEVVNIGNAPVDMSAWVFWEGDTNHGLTLIQGSDPVIDSQEYAIIAQNSELFFVDNPTVTSTVFDSSWGSLNEQGELIGLKNAEGMFIEQFTYIPANDFSLEKKDLALQDYTDVNWFEHATGHTAGRVNDVTFGNVVPEEDVVDEEDSEPEIENEIDENEDGVPILLEERSGVGIVINEFIPNPNDGELEWIELYNAATTTIDLTGFELHDGVGKISTLNTPIEALSFFVVELPTQKLNNGGDRLFLLHEDLLEDSVAYGTWDDGLIDDNAPTPQKGESVARKNNGVDTNNSLADFVYTTTPTKAAENIITVRPSADSSTPSNSGGAPGIPNDGGQIIPGEIVINELVSDPADDEEEFVELFNTTNRSISLHQAWLEDGSEAKTVLDGTIAPKGFFVVPKPKGSLNNSGDTIALFAVGETEIDRVTYGTWDDGNTTNNAPAAKDPQSLSRKYDGQDSDNDYYDFALTNTITKEKQNVITTLNEETGEIQQESIADSVHAGIKISEIFPNPKGADTDTEFIELFNEGTIAVSLQGWKLGDSSTKRYTISGVTLEPGSWVSFFRKQTGIALNNSGGEDVKLFSPSGKEIDKAQYDGSVKEGESYVRRDDNSWGWSIRATPGEKNILEGASATPIITIQTETEVAVGELVTFDASDSTDPDGDALSFVWDIAGVDQLKGETVTYTFGKEGVYTVNLFAVDTKGNSSTEKIIMTVKSPTAFVGRFLGLDPASNIRISEILPNPEGADTTEFIELFNPTESAIDLSGLLLDDEDGGSRGYRLPEGTIIEAGAYAVFGKQETGLSLNNTSDAVRLLLPDKSVLVEVVYDEVFEGVSYVFNEEPSEWQWTGIITPGEPNVLDGSSLEKKTITKKTTTKKEKPLIGTTLADIRNQDIGDRVITTGVVAVLPGVFGTQYLYMVDSMNTASSSETPGVQVYLFNKDFPKLSLGDRIEVTGELSEISGELRLKAKEKSDIRVLGGEHVPAPSVFDIGDTGEAVEGWLIEVSGEVTELKSTHMYVDDGTDEIKVYFKKGTGIDKKMFHIGDIVRVVGIMSQTKTGYQLLPRDQFDIIKTGVSDAFVVSVESSERTEDGQVAETYLTATAGGITSLLVGLFAKMHGSTAMKYSKRVAGIAAVYIKNKRA